MKTFQPQPVTFEQRFANQLERLADQLEEMFGPVGDPPIKIPDEWLKDAVETIDHLDDSHHQFHK